MKCCKQALTLFSLFFVSRQTPGSQSSVAVPFTGMKTTNKTAGHTPYPTHLMKSNGKRLAFVADLNDDDGTPKKRRAVVRRVEQQSRVIGFAQSKSMNYLYYLMCPDGLLLAFYAKGSWDGPVGFVGSSVRHLSHALADDNSPYKHLVDSAGITSILPLLDPLTGQAKVLWYAGNTKSVEVRGFVHVYKDLTQNTEANADLWTMNLVSMLNKNWNCKLLFGGNAAAQGMPVPGSLDEIFLQQDVAHLAMMGYREFIEDQSFFHDTDLVKKYFKNTENALSVFHEVYGSAIWN